MHKKILWTALALFAVIVSSARHSDAGASARLADDTIKQLDDFIAKHMQEKNLPGVVVAMSVPGEGDYIAVKGQANLATGRVRELNDPFRIASITKTFIGTAILQLVDQGKLRTSDPLSRWYPEFPNADSITVDDLLRMRSGIADSADQALLQEWYAKPLMDVSAAGMIKRAAAKAAQFEPPGRKTVYVNVNFMLLEEILKKVSGRSTGDQLSHGIFTPLGMKHTWYPTNNDLPGHLHGYSWNAQTGKFDDKTVLNPNIPGGAGAIISTMSDLKTYAEALCTGRLLKPDTHKARLATQPLEGLPDFIGYGEGIAKFGHFCGHNGTIFGFSSEMWYLPEKDAVIVINVNRLDLDDQSQSADLFLAITKMLFPAYVQW
jgi:D-alanyl-D-alanine carboxypeptidase